MKEEDIETVQVGTQQVLTVGELMQKLQFEDVDSRVCIRVQNPENTPPYETGLVISSTDGNWYDIFTWNPK